MNCVGICLACYNGEKYILAQLESLLMQTHSDFHCYIQDDGSSDDTLNVIKRFIVKRTALGDQRFQLILGKKHQGVRDNFLSLLKYTSENYLMFCDQDDVWLPEKIEVTLAEIRGLEARYGRGTPLLVFTDLIVVDEELRIIKNTVYDGAYDPYERDWKKLIRTNNNFGNTEMFNRALADLVNGIKSNLPVLTIHDNLLTSVASLTGRIEYLPMATILYRQHGSNAIGISTLKNAFFKYISMLGLIMRKDKRWGCESVKEFCMLFSELPNVPPEDKQVIDEIAAIDKKSKLQRMRIYKKYGFYHGVRLLWA